MCFFPFYSVDSISYKRLSAYYNKKKHSLLTSSVLETLVHREIKHFQTLENRITKLWEKKGVTWK